MVPRTLTFRRHVIPGLTRAHADALILEAGKIEVDNNRCERMVRPFTIGRKNWLFSSSVSGAKASADLYSLIVTAKQNGLNTYDYLKMILTKIPMIKSENIDHLMPYNKRD